MTTRAVGIGIAAALASATAYGLNVVYARQSTQLGVLPADLVFLRVFLMMGLVTGAVALTGSSLRVARADRPAVVAVGIASAAMGLCYFFALSFVPVGVAAIVVYMFPLIILLASPFVDGERFTPRRLLVFALAFAGLAVALGPGIGGIDIRGVILAGLSSIAAACQFFAAARAGRRVPPAALLFWSHVVILPIAGTVAFARGGISLPAIGAAWLPAALTVAGYVTGFVLQMAAARRAPAALIGLVFCLEPVVSIVFAGIILGETLTSAQMTGSILVLAALVASSLAELRREPQAA